MSIRVSVIQDSPVFFDKEKTLDKVAAWVKREAGEGCDLILFPESFVPGYPRGFDFGTKVGSRSDAGRELYLQYWQQSFEIGNKEQERLEALARSYEVYLILGVTERRAQSGSLYCSMLYISPHKGLEAVHRKIKPTGSERIIWAEGGKESLVSLQTPWGRLGGLICWENYMPEARMAMYSQGVEIYLAPTADTRETWTASMQHIALEGRCFVLSANQCVQASDIPDSFLPYLRDKSHAACRGGSLIVSPLGKVLAGPLYGSSGALRLSLDMEDIIRAKLDFDPIGHYRREDLFTKTKGPHPKDGP